MGKSLVGVVVMGEPRLGGLPHFDRLCQTYGDLDGLGLLRAVLKDGPLTRSIALVSSFGAESATGREPVPTTASSPASPEAAPCP
jgi:hypothetical protein